MNISLSQILKLKYPEINFFKDVVVQDDGEGAYIKEWNLETPKPTQEDLDNWSIEFELQHRQEQARQTRKYPPINEQLDMQYHDAVATDGITTRWIDAIEAVKLEHPIPTE